MEREEFFDRLRNTSVFSKKYARKSYALKKLIKSNMKNKGLDQKKLAVIIDKRESEISKWLSGFHNFTLKTLMKLEEALECDLIWVPGTEEHELKYESILHLAPLPVLVEAEESVGHHYVVEGEANFKNLKWLMG